MKPIRDLLTPPLFDYLKPSPSPSAITQRLLDGAATLADDPKSILFQHTVLCQTCLPFRDPGATTREWERTNGNIHLKVLAGEAMHPVEQRFVPVGLPFGPKARMILMHINQVAIQRQSPVIHIEDTLSKFVRRTLHLDPKGRNMRMVKDQLGRLAAASIRLGLVKDGRAVTVNSQIVTAFDIWFPKDERQRVLWPSTIRLSLDYWESLKSHAVPLDENHIACLSHSAMALDIYAWLANRLYRVPVDTPVTISWGALRGQFGMTYDPGRLDKFRAVFRVALRQVLILYREARLDLHEQRGKKVRVEGVGWREEPAKGLTLYHSPPPIPSRSR